MWYEKEYVVRFSTLLRSASIIFNETMNAFFEGHLDFFRVFVVAILVSFVAGFLLYMLRQNRK